jgi:hypothetical protein
MGQFYLSICMLPLQNYLVDFNVIWCLDLQ